MTVQRIPYGDVYQSANRIANTLAQRFVDRARHDISAPNWARSDISIDVRATGGANAHVQLSRNAYERQARIALPTLPPDTLMTRAQADTMLGYLVHELAHCGLTDAKIAMFPLLNCVEDVRIERDLIAGRHLDNARELLEGLARGIFDASARRSDAGGLPRDPVDAVQALVITLGRVERAKMDLGSIGPAMATALAGAPAIVRECYQMFRDRMDAVRSTADAEKLAGDMLAMLAQQQPQDQQPQDQQPQGDKAEGDGESEGESEGAGDEADGDEADDEGDEADGDEADDEGDEADGDEADGEGKGEGDGTGGQGASVGTPNDAMSDIVADLTRGNPEAKKWTEGKSWDIEQRAQIIAWRRCKVTKVHVTDPSQSQQIRDMLDASPKLRDQMRRALRAPERGEREAYQTAGRMDRRAWTRAEAGAANVYAKKWSTPGVDTAVFILIDRSGSMGSAVRLPSGRRVSRMEACLSMAWQIGRAIEAAGARVKIAAFNNGGDAPAGNDAIATGNHDVLKDWSERMVAVENKLGAVICANGTWCAPAVMGAAEDVASVRAVNRRIVLVLTDGECSFGIEGMRAATKIAERQGVDVIGIGVQHDVRKVFARATNVDDLSRLASEGLIELTKLLSDRRAEQLRRAA